MIQNKFQLEQSPSGFFLCRRSTLTCDALHTVYTVVSLQSIQTVKVPEGSEVKVNWNITRQSCDAAHYDNNLSATVIKLDDGNPCPKSSVFIFALISISFKNVTCLLAEFPLLFSVTAGNTWHDIRWTGRDDSSLRLLSRGLRPRRSRGDFWRMRIPVFFLIEQ